MSVTDHSTRKLKRMAIRGLKRVWRYERHSDRIYFEILWRKERNMRMQGLVNVREELKRRGEVV